LPVLVSLSGVSFGYHADLIFEDAFCQVNPGERIGVVGPNGHGKSTLLRLLAGTLPVERGERSARRGVDIGYLRQSQEFPPDISVHDLLLETFPEILITERKLAAIHERMEAGDSSEETLQEYGRLQHRFEELGGYSREAQTAAIAAEVGFGPEDLARPAGSLSGGERSRFEIARVLLREPDLLLLDEPTNHLDLVQTERLERRLAQYPKAFLLVSHDRAFLRATCTTMFEVERKKILRTPGGYDAYQTQRAQRLKRALEEYVRQNEKFEKTEDFIRRNIAGQKTKQAQSRRRMLEKIERMERPEDIWEAARHLGIEFESGDHPGGKEMIRARGLAIGYDDQPALFRDFDWTLYRGDHVGIVGPNGAGKTSLVRALLGKTKPRAGSVELGFNVQLGYLDQKLDGLEPKRSLLEEVRGVRPDLTIEAARSELGRYRFLGEDAFKAVAALSGGERCRLALLKLSLEPHNLLVLDEPTNHLDIPACEVLERALADYDGSLLVISHDRAFLDAVVNKVLWVEDERVAAYEGNYSEAKRIRSTAEEARASLPLPPPAQAEAERAGERDREREERRKAARQKKRNEVQVRALEQEIAALEARSKELNAELVLDPQGDWARLQKLVREEREIRERLERRYREWERHAQG